MSYIGVDSVLLRQQTKKLFGKTVSRKGLLGVGVEVENADDFRKVYNEAMESIFKKYRKEISRPVYCANELAKIFGSETIDKEREALTEFSEMILPAIKTVHFFYTYIFGLEKGLVSIYGQSQDYKKIPLSSEEKGVLDFYDLIENSYSMVCAWELRSCKITSELLLDNFQGRVCPAWNELAGGKGISVYYRGDNCNRLISTADLLVKMIKIKMIKENLFFVKSDIDKMGKQLFGDKFKEYFVGKQCLSKITPHVTSQIKCQNLAKHPIFYLVKENPEEEGETALIENSPLFEKVLKEVVSLGGCFKYYHPDDTRIIKVGDYIVSFGDKGNAIIKKLKKAGYPIKEFS